MPASAKVTLPSIYPAQTCLSKRFSPRRIFQNPGMEELADEGDRVREGHLPFIRHQITPLENTEPAYRPSCHPQLGWEILGNNVWKWMSWKNVSIHRLEGASGYPQNVCWQYSLTPVIVMYHTYALGVRQVCCTKRYLRGNNRTKCNLKNGAPRRFYSDLSSWQCNMRSKSVAFTISIETKKEEKKGHWSNNSSTSQVYIFQECVRCRVK